MQKTTYKHRRIGTNFEEERWVCECGGSNRDKKNYCYWCKKSRDGKKRPKKMKIHKTDIDLRQTVCGLKYDTRENMAEFLTKQIAGHWRRVTCKVCIKKRKKYENALAQKYKTGEKR